MHKSNALFDLDDAVENVALDSEQELFSQKEKDKQRDKCSNKRAS